MDEKVKSLIEWIAKNAWRDSAFLTHAPEHHVPARPLMDEICRLWSIEPTTAGAVIDATHAADDGEEG